MLAWLRGPGEASLRVDEGGGSDGDCRAYGRDFHTLRLRLYALLFAADTGLMLAAFLLANLLRFGDPLHEVGLRTFIVLWPIYLAFATSGRAYSAEALTAPWEGVSRAAWALSLAAAAVVSILFSLKVSEDFSRLIFGIGTLSSLLLIAAGRGALGGAIGRRHNWNFRNDIVLVDGVDEPSGENATMLSAELEQIRPSIDDPLMLDRVGRLLRHCDRVVLACAPERRGAWAAMLRGANVDVEILAPELDQIGALEMRRFGGRATFLIACGPIGVRDRALKRALDLGVSIGALIAFALPMLIIAAAVAIDSRGPILFRQQRTGRGNRIFQMFKFRTMREHDGGATGSQSTSRGDARVTRIGAFLRQTSLDELPQLFNVLKGEMSIVGPRPHALASTAEDRLFWNIDEHYWDRHAIKPGMTGLAQIRGHRGATLRCSDLINRLQADREYLAEWTVTGDLNIILRTIRVLIHRNAF